MVEGTVLLRRQFRKGLVGSNPILSAMIPARTTRTVAGVPGSSGVVGKPRAVSKTTPDRLGLVVGDSVGRRSRRMAA